MTLTILASVSLLALVSSARPLPLPRHDDDAWKGLQISGSGENADIQQVIQAVVKSHASLSEDLKEEEDVYVQLASSEEVQAYVSTVDSDAIKALIPLDQDELHSPDEKELYELLNRLEEERAGRSPVPDEDLDVVLSSSNLESETQVAEPSTSEAKTRTRMNIAKEFFTSTPVIVMTVSCAIALLAVSCVAVVLYIAEVLKKSVFRSTWGILPQLEKNVLSHGERNGGVSYGARRGRIASEAFEGGPEVEKEKIPGAFSLAVTTPHAATLPLPEARSDASGSEFGDESDEKFFDAEPDAEDGATVNLPAYSYIPSLPPTSGPTDSSFPPGLAALAAAAATVTAAAVAHAPDMSEVSGVNTEAETRVPIASNSGSPRPTWSVRAREAGALIHAHDTKESSSNSNSEGRRRAGMFTTPQLDAALAMQLRPGLGIGADAAWIVRFVMALFGWCAVLMSGGRWGL